MAVTVVAGVAVAWRQAGGVPLELGRGLDGGDGGGMNFWAFVFVCILLFYNDNICLFLYFLLHLNIISFGLAFRDSNKQGRQVLSGVIEILLVVD